MKPSPDRHRRAGGLRQGHARQAPGRPFQAAAPRYRPALSRGRLGRRAYRPDPGRRRRCPEGRRPRQSGAAHRRGGPGRLEGRGDPGGPGQPIEIPERIRTSGVGRRARRARHRHRDLPRRAGEIVRHGKPGSAGRAPVPGVARAGCRHYKAARSCRDGGAGPSRQRTGGCTFESRTRCLPSRYQRHGCRCGLRRRFDIHSSARAFDPPGRKSPPADRRLLSGDCGRSAHPRRRCFKAVDPPDLTGWPTGGSVSPGIDEGRGIEWLRAAPCVNPRTTPPARSSQHSSTNRSAVRRASKARSSRAASFVSPTISSWSMSA